MGALIALNRKVRDTHEIDWEQRRYEIAKEVMAVEASKSHFSQDAARYALACADALIKEMRASELCQTKR